MEDPKRHDTPACATDATSVSLLDRVKARDSAAWGRLVELYSPLLFSWCCRWRLSREDAEDTVQQVFGSVAQRIGQFRHDGQGDTFRGWLRVITRNQIRLRFRQEGHQPQAVGGTAAKVQFQEMPDENAKDGDSSDAQDASELFRRGLELIRSEFEDRTWQAFWLLIVEDRSSDDVCREFGMTPGALRQVKYKVLRRLRTELGDVLE